MLVSPRIVNDVSYVMPIKNETVFTWQAQDLVRLEDNAKNILYTTKINHESLLAWQAQRLVRLKGAAHCK